MPIETTSKTISYNEVSRNKKDAVKKLGISREAEL
jgi:hypothetical protein